MFSINLQWPEKKVSNAMFEEKNATYIQLDTMSLPLTEIRQTLIKVNIINSGKSSMGNRIMGSF